MDSDNQFMLENDASTMFLINSIFHTTFKYGSETNPKFEYECGADVARTRLELARREQNGNDGAHAQLEPGANMAVRGSITSQNVSKVGIMG